MLLLSGKTQAMCLLHWVEMEASTFFIALCSLHNGLAWLQQFFDMFTTVRLATLPPQQLKLIARQQS